MIGGALVVVVVVLVVVVVVVVVVVAVVEVVTVVPVDVVVPPVVVVPPAPPPAAEATTLPPHPQHSPRSTSAVRMGTKITTPRAGRAPIRGRGVQARSLAVAVRFGACQSARWSTK